MMTLDEQHAAQMRELLDDRARPLDRAISARRLAEYPTNDTIDVLLKVAAHDEPNEFVSFAAGESIADILIRTNGIYDAPLALFDEAMAEAFDGAVARHLRTERGNPEQVKVG